MKIARCAATLTDSALIVVTAPKITRATAKIVDSFGPKRVVSVRHLAVRGASARLGRILETAMKTRSGDDLVSLSWADTAIGPHIYDTLLMRFGLPSIHILRAKHRLHLLAELCILEGFRLLVQDCQPTMAILPDNVYRAGGFFEILAGKRIPMLAGLDMNGLAAHYYSRNGSFSSHCRTPDAALVEWVSRTPTLLSQAEAYLGRRTSGNEAQHDVRRAFGSDGVCLNRSQLCEITQLTGTKPIVLVAAHVFSDAPHAYRGLIFRDYAAWLLETCRLLTANLSVEFFVKEHPSAELYGEKGLIQQLLAEGGFSDRLLPIRVNTKSLFNCVDVVITCGGTAGAEFPCFGVPVLLAASAPYDRLGYVRRAHNVWEYAREIGRLQSYPKLGSSDVEMAKAALFVMQVVSKIPKSDLGLGSQPFMKGSDLDFALFLEEAAQDLRDGSGYRRLTDALGKLLDGPHTNMIDGRVVDDDLAVVESYGATT